MENEKEVMREQVKRERKILVARLGDWLETPMLILGFVWLVLLVIKLTVNLSPALELVGTIIAQFRIETEPFHQNPILVN